jgi:hypothetical protein
LLCSSRTKSKDPGRSIISKTFLKFYKELIQVLISLISVTDRFGCPGGISPACPTSLPRMRVYREEFAGEPLNTRPRFTKSSAEYVAQVLWQERHFELIISMAETNSDVPTIDPPSELLEFLTFPQLDRTIPNKITLNIFNILSKII